MPDRLLILVADNDKGARRRLCKHLQSAGFDTLEVDDGLKAHELVRARRPAAVILEVVLPGLDGLEVCRMMRKEEAMRLTPVILLTALSEKRFCIAGLKAGADDYVTKPYSEEELILRLGAMLRRAAERREQTRLTVGPFALDFAALKLTLNGEDKSLSRLEFKLLSLLVSRLGGVVERDVILSVVWPGATGSASRTLDTHIKRLRIKLAPHSDWLKTVRKQGYEFSDPEAV